MNATWSQKQKTMLQTFCDRTEQLERFLSLHQHSQPPSLRFVNDETIGPLIFHVGIPRDTLVAEATILRQFYLEHEPISMKAVHNLLHLQLDESIRPVRKASEVALHEFENAQRVSLFSFKFRNKLATRADFIEAWFWGEVFHSKPDWVRRWKDLMKYPGSESVLWEIEAGISGMSWVAYRFGQTLKTLI